jgi:hypothetical protein
MVLPLIGIAASLAAEFVPGLIRHFSTDKAGDVAEQVIAVAQTITGTGNPDDARTALRADPALLLQFRERMAALDAEMEKAYLADRQNARTRDVELKKAGHRNLRADILAYAAIGGLITLMYTLLIVKVPDGPARDVFLLLAGALIVIVKDVYAFEFSSSRGSKDKDAIIANLR